MGMDVFGQNPTTESGEYFRNNAWHWSPLWNYCVELAPELCGDVEGGTNDGDGLDAKGADDLAVILFNELASGRTEQYEKAFNEERAAIPQVVCRQCAGTGIRTDEVGQSQGMPERPLKEEEAILLGRTNGWCNGCNGEGKSDSMRAWYSFDAKNVSRFAEFLSDCGGFAIH